MTAGFPPGLLLVTDRASLPAVEGAGDDPSRVARALAAVVRSALGAGFDALMVREKDLDGRALLELAEPLWALCRNAERAFLVNDRLDVALCLEGAGAHVGRAGIPVADARRLLGPGRLLGYSAHAVEEAREALAAGADYVTLSPVFASRSKPGYEPRGVRFLEEAVRELPRGRVVALGGLDPANLGSARAAGAAGAAVMGAVMRAGNPAETSRELVRAWKKGGGPRPRPRPES